MLFLNEIKRWMVSKEFLILKIHHRRKPLDSIYISSDFVLELSSCTYGSSG
jgi:hypothetical protein